MFGVATGSVLSVFVSHASDMARFPAVRSFVQAAVDGVLRAGHRPVDMAYFGARDGQPAEFCVRQVAVCEVYVGLIGFRYGSLVPDGDGLSYTELEFRTATELGIPRLIFLLDEDVLPHGLADPARGPVDSFRERLRNGGLLTAAFATTDRLESAVIHGLAQLDLGRSAQVLGDIPGRPGSAGVRAVWEMPWPRNVNFTGRDGELAALRRRLAGGDGATAVVPQALHGLGGVGKSQLAVEYAYRHAADYDLVWWLPAESDEVAVTSLVELAGRLGVPAGGPAHEQITGLLEVLRRADPRRRWLVIADNATSPSDLHGLLTATGRDGHVLVTSRDPGWSAYARTIEVDVLPRADAVALLRARCPRLSEVDAERLAGQLGDLPLALEQAGGWLAATATPVATYERLLAERAGQVLACGRPAHYPVPVAAAWTVAVDRLDDPAAVVLLRLLALFAPEPVPLDLFDADTDDALPVELSEVGRDPLAFAELVGQVCALGLVRPTEDGLVMHRLVQAVLRDHVPAADRDRLRAAAQAVLASANPKDPTNPHCWTRYTALYPHVLAAGMLDTTSVAARLLVLDLVVAFIDGGNAPAAVHLARQAHTRWLSLLGDDDPDTICAAAQLADSLWSLGEYPAARAMFEDVLARRRRILGDNHPDTISAAALLADTLLPMGEYLAARVIYEDVLARGRGTRGDDDRETISAALHLAFCLRLMGECPAARAMQEDVLARRRRILGEDHLDTIRATAHLAVSLRLMGEYPAARTMQQDVLARRRRILGENHLDTIRAVLHLADTLASTGEYPAARVMQQDALARRRQILGHDHPDTIRAAADLADSLAAMGQLPAARAIQEDVLARRRRILGDDHPDTIRAAANLTHTQAGQNTE